MASHELGHRAEHATAYGFFGELSEPPLHQVEPGARCGREVEVEPGVLGQPGLDVVMAPGAVVVGYDVHGEALGHLPVDLFQEMQQLVVGVLGQALADHLAA